ncbi:MAG: FAD-dependent oxidoreductase [Pseudobutyrivibrio sp.]|nr:FAD-dependent oxidoreductase [Pseudobutyrivibrio sp.]
MSAKNHSFTEGETRNLLQYSEATKNQPVRKNLIKMVRHINMLNPFPTEDSWEYIFFNRVLTDEMVDTVLSMKLRTLYYIDDLAKRNNTSVEHMAKLAHEMVSIGILEYCTDDDGVDRVQVPVFAPGAMENTAYTPEILENHPEIAPAFLNYILDLQKVISNAVPMGQALMRAIPVEKAIEGNSQVVSTDKVSYWLDKAGESIAVGYCECRRLRRMVDEGTFDLEGEWCISLGKYAESLIRVGKHRRISRAEAEEILLHAEKNGYVHQLSNIDGPDFSLFICNCAWDTCMALKTSWYTSSPNLSSSNYRAHVDPEKCVACAGCVEVCPENAVKLGEKLCTKEHVVIEPHKIPGDTLFFGKKYWNGNELLTDRKHVYEETGTAPCKSACPAHIAVQGYLKLAAQGKYKEALELIKKENPFPAVCGSVCHRYCEKECTRGEFDSPLAIDEVKKFIAEQDLKSENHFVPEKYYNTGEKIAIIGAGPAGLTCAYYLAIYGHNVTVFEKNEKPGGMMVYGMPSFRLNKEIVNAEIEIIKELGVEIKCGIEVGKDITLDELRAQGYKGFYAAIGAQGGRKLGVPGEEANGVISGVEFLKNVNTDNSFKLNGKTVVVGGGNVAIDVARTALRCGSTVELFSLEGRNEMPASNDEVEEALEENIGVNNGYGPKEILFDSDGNVTGIVFKRCISVKDSEGRFNPQYDDNDLCTVECNNIITAIGQSIEWGNIFTSENVEFNRNNTIKADAWTYQTGAKDVFAGGDAYTGPRFCIDAIAAGKEAADSLHRFVHEGHSLTLGRMKRDNFKILNKSNIDVKDYDKTCRQIPKVNKEISFKDPRSTFTEEQVKAETARCLSCGRAIVDTNMCIGCGLCTTRCKFDAIHITRDYDKYGVPYEKLVGAVVKEELSRVGRAVAKPFRGREDLNA